MSTVIDIEDSILATLAADETLSGYVKSFAAVPALDQASLEKTFRKLPAIGVISEEGVYDYALGYQQADRGTFAVLCFAKNMRSPVAGMRGGVAAEKGVWDMIDDCRRVLLAETLTGVTVIDCLAKRRKLIYAGDRGAVAALEVEVQWRS